MKKIIFLKGMLSVVMLFIASLTISAAKPGDNLVHNTEEVYRERHLTRYQQERFLVAKI